MIKENFIKLYETSFKENWSLSALTNYSSGTTYSYGDLAKNIAKIHLQLDYMGISKGDKVALLGKDSAEWCIVFMGVISYGAVIVPILPDFHKNDVNNIVNDSDARVLYISQSHYESIDPNSLPALTAVIDIESLEVIDELSINKSFLDMNVETLMKAIYPEGFQKKDIKYKDISNNDVLMLNYTSGTTGYSKGVILTANNLAGNVSFAMKSKMMIKYDRMLCFLPLSHTYSCAFNFLSPLALGVHVFILGAMPTPSILLKAFSKVKPNLILSVPLILEKTYKNVITPAISKGLPKYMLKVPVINKLVFNKIREQLYNSLGGNFRELIIGGAALNDEVCSFLHKAKFPFTVGYGMTECGPLITYETHKKYVPKSCGKPLKGVMEVRIYEADKKTGIGEIQCKGENVCKGYYKNATATEELFTADGWMRTGDLGYMDNKQNVFIKGRSKNMLLGPNGQNIYTEAIEAKISMMPFVSECVIVMDTSKRLAALIYPDNDQLKAHNLSKEELQEKMKENLKVINQDLGAYEQLAYCVIRNKEFEKTPKKSIKRFLYKHTLDNLKI